MPGQTANSSISPLSCSLPATPAILQKYSVQVKLWQHAPNCMTSIPARPSWSKRPSHSGTLASLYPSSAGHCHLLYQLSLIASSDTCAEASTLDRAPLTVRWRRRKGDAGRVKLSREPNRARPHQHRDRPASPLRAQRHDTEGTRPIEPRSRALTASGDSTTPLPEARLDTGVRALFAEFSQPPHGLPASPSNPTSSSRALCSPILLLQAFKRPRFTLHTVYSRLSASRHAVNDTHELYDPITSSFTPERQQQLNPPQAVLHTRPSTSSGGSAQTLRRTPRFGDDLDLLKREQRSGNPQARRLTDRPGPARRRYTQGSEESSQFDRSTTPGAETPGLEESYWPRRSNRTSTRTATAILFALEEAIRAPFPFTPDPAEEEARLSMAGLRSSDAMPGGPPPPISERDGARTVTPPTEIMARRRRREQEAREREEEMKRRTQQRDQDLAQERQEQVEKRRSQDRRDSAAAGPTGGIALGNTSNAPRVPGRQPLNPIQPADPRRNNRNVTDPPRTRPSIPDIPPDHRRTLSEAHQASGARVAPQPAPTSRPRATSTADTQPASSLRQPQTEQPEQRRTKATSSFPHAFERWETLSSHWEGLTGYWIKRLQNNADELHGQPLNQQLARQVTDLSAAGANLFHAVVELQRLRASSERKFQRWFFETRGDQEKQTEEIARLKAQLREVGNQPRDQPAPISREMQERHERLETEHRESREQLRQTNEALRALQEQSRQENDRIKQAADKQLQQMRRELQISRDEARRGWEEIGRMEQSERDRMFSLRSGQATLVGNIQVVPMPRQATSSRPTTREGGLSSHPVQPEDIQYANYGEDRSQTDTDPFTESAGRNAASVVTSRIHGLLPESQPQTTYATSAAAVEAGVRAAASPGRAPASTGAASPRLQPSATQTAFPPRSESMATARPGPTSAPGSAGFYQQGQSVLHQQPGQAPPQVLQAEEVRSYGTMSDDGYSGDSQAYTKRDTQNRPTVYAPQPPRSPSEASDDYGTTTGAPSGYTYTTTNGNSQGVGAPDYSGAGYGGGEWGAVLPRHHHPTRLSDVPEADEWSRTSPSRASERSRGFR